MPDFGPFIVAGASLGSAYALSGVGIVVLFRATGTLNLAHGALGAVSALVAWELEEQRGWPIGAAIGIGVSCAIALAWLYSILVARRLLDEPPIVQASATLGLLLAALGSLNWYWPDIPRRLRLPSDNWAFEVIGIRVTGTRLLVLLLTLAITATVATVLARTRLGLHMRALADNRSVSTQIGIPVNSTTTAAWLMAGFIAGLSGILLGNLSRLDGPSLTFFVIPALAAAVAGRLTSLGITLIAGVSMGLIESLATPIDAISDYRTVAPYLVGLLAVFWFARNPERSFG
ncbi:MAG: branched-chain amino acid ABC transporter permease [Acidimicrobiales bacterium]